MPRALLSVSDKTGIVDVGRGLAARGFELVSTGGTARALTAAGLAVTSVSDRDRLSRDDGRPREDAAPGAARRHPRAPRSPRRSRGARAPRPRPRRRRRRQPLSVRQGGGESGDTPFDALVEEIDIGGPSLVRAAAKNFRGVLVVVDPADYPRLLEALDETPSLAFRFELMRKALAHTAAYDTAIARDARDDRCSTATRSSGTAGHGRELGDRLDVSLEKIRDLRYGENPHQRAAWYRRRHGVPHGRRPAGVPALGDATILQGKELSYTNLLDLDAAARIVLEFDEPAAAVIKHTNPCGAAIGDSRRRRLRARARRRQPRGLRRHRRAQPADRCRDGGGHRLDLHRGGHRAVGRRGRARRAGAEDEHARA